MIKTSCSLLAAGLVLGGLALVGCGPSTETPAAGTQGSTSGDAKLSGRITIDGSSTVFVVTNMVAEGFMDKNPDVKVNVSFSGTGNGFKKFAAGETDISNASRPISEKELEAVKTANIEFIEVPVAYDGLTVVVNKENTWVDKLTVAELKKIWEPAAQGKVMKWSDVRAGWPETPLKLYGAGTGSGTFDYFTKVIVGEEKSSRTDYTPSEDDNQLVTGVAGDKGALGYFGFAYYLENQDKLKAVPIDNGNGPITPSAETINNRTYAPLSRPEFIYIKKTAMDQPHVKAFVEFYLSPEGQELITKSGYVPFKADVYERILAHVKSGATGSKFTGQLGKSVEEIFPAAQ